MKEKIFNKAIKNCNEKGSSNHTKYLLNLKLEGVEKYSEKEIGDGIFFIKQPSVERIITKWAD